MLVDLLGFVVILLRLLRELADLGEDRVDRLLQGRLALRQHLLEAVDDRRQRLLDVVGQVVRDLFELVDAELRLGLALLELRLQRIHVLLRFVPLLFLALLDPVLAAVEDRLARLVRLVAVLLDVQAGLDPLASVLVDRVLDLLLVLVELLLVLVDGALHLVDEALRLVDVALQLVADLLLEGLLGFLDRFLRLGDRVLRLGHGLLGLVERVLRAGRDGAQDGLVGRISRLLDRVDHLGQVATDPLDQRLGHLVRLGRAHLDGALALHDRGVGERHARLARGQRRLGRGEQALLHPLHRAGERPFLVACGVDGVERRRFHRVEGVLGVLIGVLGQVDDVRRRLVRRLERLLRRVLGRGRRLSRGRAHL